MSNYSNLKFNSENLKQSVQIFYNSYSKTPEFSKSIVNTANVQSTEVTKIVKELNKVRKNLLISLSNWLNLKNGYAKIDSLINACKSIVTNANNFEDKLSRLTIEQKIIDSTACEIWNPRGEKSVLTRLKKSFGREAIFLNRNESAVVAKKIFSYIKKSFPKNNREITDYLKFARAVRNAILGMNYIGNAKALKEDIIGLVPEESDILALEKATDNILNAIKECSQQMARKGTIGFAPENSDILVLEKAKKTFSDSVKQCFIQMTEVYDDDEIGEAGAEIAYQLWKYANKLIESVG